MDPQTSQQTNYLHRNFEQNVAESQKLELKEATLQQQEDQKQKKSNFQKYVIIILLLTTFGSLGIIFLLLLQMPSPQRTQLTTTRPAIQATINSDSSEQSGGVSLAGKQVEQLVEKKMAETQQQNSTIYSQALNSARDVKRKADLTALATTMNVYMMENDGVPKDFPDEPKCIGTDSDCYNLYKLLVPDYIEKQYLDDAHGTSGNSGYKIGKSHDGITSFVALGISESGEVLEVRK